MYKKLPNECTNNAFFVFKHLQKKMLPILVKKKMLYLRIPRPYMTNITYPITYGSETDNALAE